MHGQWPDNAITFPTLGTYEDKLDVTTGVVFLENGFCDDCGIENPKSDFFFGGSEWAWCEKHLSERLGPNGNENVSAELADAERKLVLASLEYLRELRKTGLR